MSEETKIKAIAKHFSISVEEAEESFDGDETFAPNGREEYRVLTDSEADEAWDAYLDSYIDDCILPELPGMARNYFDSEKWKRDAKFDGRGHCLSPYDGNEEEVQIDGEWIYIYRVN